MRIAAHNLGSDAPADQQADVRTRVVHGCRRAFRIAGSGPALLLIHGIGDSSRTWDRVIEPLARNHLVIAPDLLGHGESDKPRADYSVAAYANAMRDLLSLLGVERATVVGHSFGGGVAMQFAYQFPERTERLVLIGAGGAGRDVAAVLRVAALPGAGIAATALRVPGVGTSVSAVSHLLGSVDPGLRQDTAELRRVLDALPDREARAAFFRTLRSVVDWRGQVVTMLDRCYLTSDIPTMLIWGGHDRIVPVRHAWQAHAAMPGSELVVFDDAAHFPFRSEPERFVDVLQDFCLRTVPAQWSPQRWQELISHGNDGTA